MAYQLLIARLRKIGNRHDGPLTDLTSLKLGDDATIFGSDIHRHNWRGVVRLGLLCSALGQLRCRTS